MSEAETYDVDRSRRTFLITGISLAAAGSVPIAALAATEKTNAASIAHSPTRIQGIPPLNAV